MARIARPPITEFTHEWRSPKVHRLTTDRVIVHHSAADPTFGADDFHRWHLDRGWRGIGYHFVITPSGEIQAGREVDAVGAHCLGGWNSRSVAICVAGNFQDAEPTDAQLSSLASLCAWLCQEFGRSPLTDITGHADQQPTACPGARLYAHLGEVRHRVGDLMAGQSAPEPEPADVLTEPYEQARARLVALGITDGSDPARPATRAEVWVYLDRMLALARIGST